MTTPPSILNQITLGDCRELSRQIPDGSVDIIFTDPPYNREALPLYSWLAQEAARVLKTGGFLLTYSGNSYLHEVMMALGKHLTYFWCYIALDTGHSTVVWQRKTVVKHKAILAYSKGPGKPRCNVLDVWSGSGRDKTFHAWGQDAATARYYIDCFSRPGEIVLDPFVGGGTVATVCRQIGRNFIAFEIDPQNVEIARNRLATMQMPLIQVRNPGLKTGACSFPQGAL